MSCERFREALSRHAAGADIGGAAGAHLAGCDACAARLELQRQLLSEVDGELERALAIDASPELVARVIARSRGARDAAWRVRAAWAGLAAAAALAVGVYLRAPEPAVSSAPRESAVAAPATAPALAEAAAPSQPDRQPAVGRSHARPSGRQAAARPVQEPPVIVGPEQVRAIARLRELLAEGLLTARMLPPEPSPAATELSVTPLLIPEITVPDVESVGRIDAASRGRQ